MKYENFQERFDWLLGFMALDDPFTHELLMLLRREEVKSIPTMGVSVEGSCMTLGYNREYMESLSDEQIRYAFSHEMFHLALHHCTTRRPTDAAERMKHNIAADLAINCLIVENNFRKAPEGILFPSQFKFKDKLSMEQYFDLLPTPPKENNQDKSDKEGNGEGEGDGSGGGEGDDDKEGNGKGDGKEGDKKGKNGGKGSGKGVGKKLGSHGGFDCHEGWSDEENTVADEIIRQKIREMENSDRYWGNMPGDVKQTILAAQKSRIAWHRLLRAIYGHVITKTWSHTFKRPNRRFGYPYTGFKRDCTGRALLLWDTSGSIHDNELSKFLSETNRIAETMPVDIQMFDHALQGKVVPFNRKMKSIDVKGRGGTSFEEPFALADKMRYETVICLTDGQAPAIERPRHVKNIIWAIVGVGNKPPVTWGKILNIDTVNGRVVQAPPEAEAA
jgi:predicted metal-dependent peptidase